MKKIAAALLVTLNICALCSCSASSTCNAGKLPDLSDPQIRQRIEAKKDKPDLELLSKITLPKDPTEQQARDYINAVLLASRNQQNYQASDPQVAMLVEVGHKNIDELLLSMRGSDFSQVYAVAAVKALAQNEDKEKIIAALYERPRLVEVITAKGWVKEAQGVLIKKLHENQNYLPYEWIAAVASLQDPSTYDDLISYFMNGSNRRLTYKYIARLPGIDLTRAAPIAWERARGDRYEIAELTEAALSAGYLPALDFVFETLDNNNNLHPSQYSPRALIFQFTSIQGSNEELKKWYEVNRSSLRFDAGLKRFVASNKQR
ncbi:MAG: hypothetical protein WA946_00320 [Nitrospirota bacterium]